MGNIILEMKGINKIFPGTQALSNVDFQLRRGEIHALIGTNGSGKSTLMNILSGAIRSTNGIIMYKGEQQKFSSPFDAIKNKIIMIHQELKLVAEITVAENIFFGRFPKTKLGMLDWKEMNIKAGEIIKALDSSIEPDQLVSELSVARQQLVEIAKALSQDAEILIMDEPTASLTSEETSLLFKVMRNLSSKGVSIIFISHRLGEVLEVSDRITVLRDSLLVGTIEKGKDFNKEKLVNMMIRKEGAFKQYDNQECDSKVMFSARNISYSNKVIDVSFDLKKGEVLGIAGLLGAGRTELFKCIFGQYQISSGEFYINDKQYYAKHPKDAVKHKIAYVTEDRKREGLILSMSISDNMIFASFDKFKARILLNRKKQKEYVAKQIDDLKLRCNSQQTLVNSLSGGNQQKVVLAKWLLADCDIILMDEPTRGIDIGAKNEIYALVMELASQGKGVIFVSSELEEVQFVSNRILVMSEGRLVKELPNKNTTLEEIMCYATGK